MRYVARIVAVFPVTRTDPFVFDVWENIVVVEAEGPRRALERAIALSRSLLDDDANCAALGYSSRPILYGVRELNSAVELPETREPQRQNPRTLVRTMSISKADFDKLKSFEGIQCRFQLMHIETTGNDV